jgi:hypothetical protein
MNQILLLRIPKLALQLAPVFLLFCCPILPQSHENGKKKSPPPGSDWHFVRHVDVNAPCKFAAVYQRINEDKTDPRVAFIEVSRFVHVEEKLNFRDLCQEISDQSLDTYAVFDKSRGFLQIVWGGDISDMTDALAYFSGRSSRSGVILYMKRDGEQSFQPFVFTYQNEEWHDVTKDYLGEFKLGPSDYIVVPQYGRTARVVTYNAEKREFHHKLWLHWNGVKFEAQASKPKDWRCPDSYRYIGDDERPQCCQ